MATRPLLGFLALLLALACAGAASGQSAPKPLTARDARTVAYHLDFAIAQERAALTAVGTDPKTAKDDIVGSAVELVDAAFDLKGRTVKNQDPLADVQRARQFDAQAVNGVLDPTQTAAVLDALRQALAAKKRALRVLTPLYAVDRSDPWCSGFAGKGTQSGIRTSVSFTCHLGQDPATDRKIGDGWTMEVRVTTPTAFPGLGGSYQSEVSGKRSGVCHPDVPAGTNAVAGSHAESCAVDGLHAGAWTIDWPNTDGKNTIASCGELVSVAVFAYPRLAQPAALGWAANLTLGC